MNDLKIQVVAVLQARQTCQNIDGIHYTIVEDQISSYILLRQTQSWNSVNFILTKFYWCRWCCVCDWFKNNAVSAAQGMWFLIYTNTCSTDNQALQIKESEFLELQRSKLADTGFQSIYSTSVTAEYPAQKGGETTNVEGHMFCMVVLTHLQNLIKTNFYNIEQKGFLMYLLQSIPDTAMLIKLV